MKRGDTPKRVSLDLAGAQNLTLAVIDANDGTAGDNADWAGAAIITTPGQQSQVRVITAEREPAPRREREENGEDFLKRQCR